MAPNTRRRRPAAAGLPACPSGRRAQAGFTMIELMIAIVLLMVGVVAVAQLVPNAMQSNFRNRYDSTGLILAQRQLEQMMNQPLDAGLPAVGAHYAIIVDADSFQVVPPPGITVNLGLNDPLAACPFAGIACSVAGADVVTLPSGHIVIDWSGQATAAVPAGYIHNFQNAEGYQYETRWRVMTIYQTINGADIEVAKRFVLSTRGGPPGVAQPPTTLTGMVTFGTR